MAGSIPLVLWTLGLMAFGGIYTLGFVILLPRLWFVVPDSVYKTIIVYGIIWFAPILVIIIGIAALVIEGMKRNPSWEAIR